MYYFAYGSNMSQKQMKVRCPGSRLVGPGVLKDYKLDFTISTPGRWNEGGCADVVSEPDTEVWGLVYELTQKDLQNLDNAEGKWYRRILVPIGMQSSSIDAFVYEVVDKAPPKPSARQYLDIIKNAAVENGFPQSYKDYLDSVPVQTES